MVIISSSGSMATRWLAYCFSRDPTVLVLHGRNVVVPVQSGFSEADAKNNHYLEELNDWPLNYDEETFPLFMEYLEKLRKSRGKDKVIAIHTTPVHGNKLKESLEKYNGTFLMLVREPMQALDSQYATYKKLSAIKHYSHRKTGSYVEGINRDIRETGNRSLGTIIDLNLLPFTRLVIEIQRHFTAAFQEIVLGIQNQVKEGKVDKIHILKRDFVTELHEKTGVFRFEDVTEFRDKTLINLYSAAMGERRSAEDLKMNVFFNSKINVHRQKKITSEEIYDKWTKSQCLIFHSVLHSRKLFCMNTFVPNFYALVNDSVPDEQEFNDLQFATPFSIFFNYSVNNFY